jgi:hypothetical protein
LVKKTILTFLSQGAAAGAASNFLWLIFLVCYQPNFYNFLFLWYLPFALTTGAIIGTLFGTVVWLARQLLKQELKWWARWLLATSWYLIFAAYSSINQFIEPQYEYYDGQQQAIQNSPFHSHLLVYVIVSAALASLLVGSRINVGRTLVFGTRQTALPFAQLNSFSFVAHLLLRIGSLCGLLISLFLLAYLVSMIFAPWGAFDNEVVNEAVIESIVAIFYFTGSVYASSANPRRPLLIALAVTLNVPLAIWILRPPDHGMAEVDFVGVMGWVFICLWMLVVVGRLISSDETNRPAPAETTLVTIRY